MSLSSYCRLISWVIHSVAPSRFAPCSRRSCMVSRLPRRVGYYYSGVYSGFKFIAILYKMSRFFAYYRILSRSVWTIERRWYRSPIMVVVPDVIVQRASVVSVIIVRRCRTLVSRSVIYLFQFPCCFYGLAVRVV